jgi:hypothetical protein
MHSSFFSASSFYPGRVRDDTEVIAHLPSYASNGERVSNSDNGDTEIDSEEEWLTEPPLEGPATRNGARASDAMLIEVSIHFFLLS